MSPANRRFVNRRHSRINYIIADTFHTAPYDLRGSSIRSSNNSISYYAGGAPEGVISYHSQCANAARSLHSVNAFPSSRTVTFKLSTGEPSNYRSKSNRNSSNVDYSISYADACHPNSERNDAPGVRHAPGSPQNVDTRLRLPSHSPRVYRHPNIGNAAASLISTPFSRRRLVYRRIFTRFSGRHRLRHRQRTNHLE
jgi:hypothetical protein